MILIILEMNTTMKMTMAMMMESSSMYIMDFQTKKVMQQLRQRNQGHILSNLAPVGHRCLGRLEHLQMKITEGELAKKLLIHFCIE